MVVIVMLDAPEPIVPQPVPEPVLDLSLVLDAVVSFFDTYIHFEYQEQCDTVALWAVATWVYDAFDVVPYIGIKSPEKRSGKTLLLDALELIVREPIATSNISPAALYRIVEERHPTLLVDEVDAVFAGGKAADASKQELRGLLNDGFRKGRKTYRVGGPKRDTVQGFDVFGPKALAGIGNLPDTIADRVIPIGLQRKPRNVYKQRFRMRKVTPIGHELRDDIALVTTDLATVLGTREPDLPEALNDREQDTWELMFSLADEASIDWGIRARAAAVKLAADAVDNTETKGQKLLEDIQTVWGDDEAAIPTKVLLERLCGLEESPWANWYGKEIDARFIAKTLRPYGVTSRTVKWHTDSAKGYRREHLAPVWERYLWVTSVTSVTIAQPQGFAGGNRGVTQRSPSENDTQGDGKVTHGLPTETPRGTREVTQVTQVSDTPTGECPECGNTFAPSGKCINDKCRFWDWDSASIDAFRADQESS